MKKKNAKCTPVEIKAGATLNRDYFSGIRHFVEGVAEPNPYTAYEGLLVYAGERVEQRSSIHITHPAKLSTTLGSLENSP